MISVVIPLYNKERCIKDTISSVLSQTYKDFELIIVNDGSTDSSLQVVEGFNDPRIRIINKPNEGVSRTRNRGVVEAHYDLIYFLDADDFIFPNGLEILISLFKKYPNADLWSANYIKKYQNSEFEVLRNKAEGIIGEPHKLYFYDMWRFRIGSYIISKESFFQIGGFPIDITIGEDYFFAQRYINKFKCVYTPQPVMSYLMDNRGLSRKDLELPRTVEWHLFFEDNNKWQKLAFSELLIKSVIKSMMKFKFRRAISIMNKYGVWPLYGTYAIIKKYLHNYVEYI